MEAVGYTTTDYVSFIASFSTILYYTTGWPLVWKVRKRKDTGIVSTFPYVAFLTNQLCATYCVMPLPYFGISTDEEGKFSCTIWVAYGYLSTNSVLMFVNSIGAIHQILYILVFYFYSKSKRLFNLQLLYSLMFLVAVYTYIYMYAEPNTIVNILGVVGSCLSILAYASPLSAMGEVVSTKSTASMSFTLCLANLIVSIEWTIYGAFLGDNFIVGPNSIGVLVSICQLTLFCIYPTHPATVLPS